MKRILLAGAGHAHLVVLLALERMPLYGARIALVSPHPVELYSGMLPGVLAGHYLVREAEVDVAALAKRAHVEYVQGSVASLDLAKRTAVLTDGGEASYDAASLNVGARIAAGFPGARELAIPVKPMRRFLEQLGDARRVAVVGAGAGGAEIAMALHHAGRQVTLYSAQSSLPPALGRRLVRVLRARRLDFRPGMAVTAIEPGLIVHAGTTRQEFDRAVLATGATAHPWLAASGLAVDEGGFARVKGTLQSVSHPEVFAAGDCASLAEAAHPRSGVYSVRHGRLLADNLRRLVAGAPLAALGPPRPALSLVSCGGRYAIAEWNAWTAEGRPLWWWKDWIDRRWIRRLSS